MFESLPKISEIVKSLHIQPLKSLGQNFLFDQNITDRIASSSEIKGNNILEIGPGPGGLTRSILKNKPKKLILVEPDNRVIPILEELHAIVPDTEIKIINDDILNIDLSHLFEGEKFHVIANLPYYISTEILIKLVKNYNHVISMTMMFQKELAHRICSQPNSKEYGRLSIMSQSLYNPMILFNLSPNCFYPKPKIYSSVVKFDTKKPRKEFDILKLEELTKKLFQERRKMIRKALTSLQISPVILENLNIKYDQRAENLSVDQYIELSKSI